MRLPYRQTWTWQTWPRPTRGWQAGLVPRPISLDAATPATLGIDVGTTQLKAALVAWPAGGSPRIAATAVVATPDTADTLIAAAAHAVADCLALAPGLRPDAVGVSSMAETGVPLAADGSALCALVGWADDRATESVADLARDIGAAELFEATGVRLGPKPPLAKWHWFARREPELWRRTAMWAGAGDLIVHALTGRYVTDHTLAGRTGALRLGDAGFDAELTTLGGLDRERLPEVLTPGQTAGVTRPGALGGGLPVGIPVYVAGHDHAVGAHAVGVRAPGQVADSLGTSEAIYAVIDPVAPGGRTAVAAQGMSVVRTVAGDAHAVVAGSPAAGRLLDWWLRTLMPGRTPQELFAELDRAAAADVLVLPYLLGRQAPAPEAKARLEIRGLTADAGPATVAEGLVRGLVLHARWMTQVACGGRPRSVVLLGGPTRNEGWVRRKAELSPWPVARATEPDAVAAGAALVAAERAGLREAGASPLVSTVVEAHRDPRGEELYAAFLTAVGADMGSF